MHCSTRVFSLLAVLTLPVTGSAQAQPTLPDADALQKVFEQIIRKAEPSVACVLVSRSEEYVRHGPAPSADAPGKLGRFTPRPDLAEALKALDLARPDHVPEVFGSAVVIDESGLVLTCAHVIRKATKIYVRLPGNRGSYADIYAADPRSDFAVLKLLDPPPELKALKIGDGGKLRKGHWIISVANPFAIGFRNSSPCASVGVVKNFRQRDPAIADETDAGRRPLHEFGTLLQTELPVILGKDVKEMKDVRSLLGFSGGALLNLDGELVGLTTTLAALSGDEPGSFAIPMDAAMRRIVEVLRRGEEVEYGFLGISMTRAPQQGVPVQINEVIPGGPAKEAGLLSGEFIVAIDGRPVRDFYDLVFLVGIGLAGNEVKVELARGSPGGRRREVMVRLTKSPVTGAVIASNRPPARAGLRVDHASIVARQNHEIPVGVAIREVIPDSPADRARLQSGKVIKRVNGKVVTSPTEFYRAMEGAGRKIELTILDFAGQQEETITITIDND